MQGSMVMTMEKALSPALSDIDLRLVSRILYPGRLIIKCPARTVDIIIMLTCSACDAFFPELEWFQ